MKTGTYKETQDKTRKPEETTSSTHDNTLILVFKSLTLVVYSSRMDELELVPLAEFGAVPLIIFEKQKLVRSSL